MLVQAAKVLVFASIQAGALIYKTLLVRASFIVIIIHTAPHCLKYFLIEAWQNRKMRKNVFIGSLALCSKFSLARARGEHEFTSRRRRF
jgi:hypothetical protein